MLDQSEESPFDTASMKSEHHDDTANQREIREANSEPEGAFHQGYDGDDKGENRDGSPTRSSQDRIGQDSIQVVQITTVTRDPPEPQREARQKPESSPSSYHQTQDNIDNAQETSRVWTWYGYTTTTVPQPDDQDTHTERREARGTRHRQEQVRKHTADHGQKHPSTTYASRSNASENSSQERMVRMSLTDYDALKEELKKAKRLLGTSLKNLQEEKEKVERAQKAALALADRFQPTMDEDIKESYTTLGSQVKKICKALHAQEPLRQPDQWPQGVCWEPFIRPVQFSDKTSRRGVLMGVVWKYLVESVFTQRFSCFGGDLGRKVNELHAKLFANQEGNIEETEESARWRASTAEYLMRSYPSEDPPDVTPRNLQAHLDDILTVDMGYNLTAKTQTLIREMLEKADECKRLLMKQRAVFKTFIPDPERFPTKMHDDKYLANNEEEEDGMVDGEVWFVMAPGLLKQGTGRGTNLNDREFETVIVPALVRLR